jgi:hypothetical protein
MKRAVILIAAMLLVASASYAPCFYPHSRHEEYWQHHSSCEPNCRPFQIYTDWWSLDGECDVDCDGTRYCSGDTEIRSDTIVEYSFGPCDPICE